MNTNQDRDRAAPRTANEASAPRKRFRIEKLEERIAPTKGGKGTHHCGGSSITIGTATCSFY